jgi:hypothetical protein
MNNGGIANAGSLFASPERFICHDRRVLRIRTIRIQKAMPALGNALSTLLG